MPVTGSFLTTVFGAGLRLSSFMAGLNGVVSGTLVFAATKRSSSGCCSLSQC